ncbi:monocarboxylate uptake permease MctP [Acidocella sp.]|uniref:monocarboxylate uptake permease MctP n=1 Tax=Acidocella sp. TaxID=50710 RepID=UPI00262E5F5E|nr:sodium:solute symporter [Acidocella sp.]
MNTLLPTVIFFVLVALVLGLGFAAARFGGEKANHIEEWGLGGRRFGTLLSWFLIGGDAYTAYTFIAIPALMFGAGAIGFFAMPYTIVIYPILYMVFPRLWRVAKAHGYITGPEFVRGRYGNKWLALAVGVTGIVATMPYIALQLVGMQTVIGALGIPGHLPLVLAFLVLGGFTYTAGLKAPAVISVVKDLLIYLTVLVAIIAIPAELGGFGAIFAKVPAKMVLLAQPPAGSTGGFSAYGSLALGSALALFLYPHTMTGVLSSAGPKVIKRNAVLLPAYSLMLGFLALLGFMAIAMGVKTMPQFAAGFAHYGTSFAVPALLMATLPSWFVGVAFAAIAIGALVPASIMAIAAANIFARDIWGQFTQHGPDGGAKVAKLFSILVILGALAFVLALPLTFAVQLQLLGGMWLIQTVPAIMISVFTRRLNGWAVLVGWAAGIGAATWLAALNHFAAAIWPFHVFGYTVPCYIALATLLLNLLVAWVLTPLFNALAPGAEGDETCAADYV